MHTNHRSTGWMPPHCPNRNCRYHTDVEDLRFFRRRGSYRSRSVPDPVQRFDCRACGVSFSTQTFKTTYWLKRPDLLQKIFMRLVGCMCARQIARDLECSPETVNRLIARLGRHSLLFHMEIWKQQAANGPIVVDGFESFEYSQYHPIHHHVAVESETGFWLYHTDSELRRKGRMTKFQKKRRKELEAEHGRPDPQSVRKDMTELLEVSLENTEDATVLSDEHKAYPPAIRSVECRIRHSVTNSKKPRTSRNPLFPVNELDLLIRHSQANHKRETIAFSRRRQASAERLAVLQVWRNYIKWHREKKPGMTPAMLKGLLDRRLSVADVLEERLFPGRVSVPKRWRRYYRRWVTTREIARNRTHGLSYAF